MSQGSLSGKGHGDSTQCPSGNHYLLLTSCNYSNWMKRGGAGVEGSRRRLGGAAGTDPWPFLPRAMGISWLPRDVNPSWTVTLQGTLTLHWPSHLSPRDREHHRFCWANPIPACILYLPSLCPWLPQSARPPSSPSVFCMPSHVSSHRY